ncbi:MAG TPA: selenide, water dikinase SelD [Anaerohalosphaeraceae bacterium]|jgi:selenide,water dikinase|nr:selenide, water dikinase SelD [Anaerohalosphaeraceae bacterium]HRT50634.1 selenide, water dikinase SelD [Anaerohalosphaeraceae bacterium]HRT86541.1 selenide, water dikinase SelD [Anaerohalosphaeraceae bacterium]
MRNLEKRKRIMKRSIKLGHCICDPKQPCPCDLFKSKDICLCAGERLDSPVGEVKLTQLVEKAGCASKIDQAFLKQVLKGLPVIEDPRVLVGVPAGDDAGIYDIGDGKALVQTVDVFTPSVDDPYTFGQIAAANSVSDIYAMGGVPLTALSVIGFPVRKIPDNALTEILRGGIDKMKEAGVAIIGGHSINDPEIKAGFAVTGIMDIKQVTANANARPGDVLILTKPLGTGIVAFASQIGRALPESVEASARSMTTLNRDASRLMVAFGAHACTDVTGFSLMGHLAEMALSSGVDVEVIWDDLPLLPHVLQYAADGILPGAIERNKESCGDRVIGDGLTAEMLDICFDAQTSGGLLIAIDAADADRFLKALHEAGVAAATMVGRVLSKGEGIVRVRTTGRRTMPAPRSMEKGAKEPVPVGATQPPAELTCCATVAAAETPCCTEGAASPASSASKEPAARQRFMQFMAQVNRPGGLDAFTKQAISIALAVAQRCEPCIKSHVAKAREKGFSEEEIDEAAWLGIAFGGAPCMMFYEQHKPRP